MCGITDPAGCVVAAARSSMEAMAVTMADAASWMITESFTWWVDAGDRELNTGVVTAVREVTMPFTVSVAAAGMIVLGIRMVLSGSHDLLLSIGEGITKLVFWTVAGTTVLTALMRAASGFSTWVLDDASSSRLGTKLLTAFDQPVKDNVGLILLLSLLGFLAGVVQWVLSLFREGALVVLAGCLPLAASGQLGLGTHWLSKITGWCLALIFWQPAASLVYFAAFAMMENARGPQQMLVGITMLVIAVFALPMLMKLFTWVVASGGGAGGGGGSSRLAGAAMAYQLRGAARSGGGRMSPGQHARMVDSSLPRQGGGGTPRPGGPGGPAPGGAPGAGNSGGSGASPTAAGAVPGSRTASPAAAPPAAKAGPAAGASGASGATAPAGGAGGAAAGAGGAASGAGAGGTAGAGGAKASAAAGPIGAAAAAAVMVGAAGAKTAGRAMTEGADTPPPPPNSGSRRDAT